MFYSLKSAKFGFSGLRPSAPRPPRLVKFVDDCSAKGFKILNKKALKYAYFVSGGGQRGTQILQNKPDLF